MTTSIAPEFDESGHFLGFTGRECGEHRTVGAHRAWCYDCGEWCYPSTPCVRCELPTLRARIRDLEAAAESPGDEIAPAR